MNSARPAQVCAALEAFRLRGGYAADNPDGWGVAYLENGAFRLHKEAVAGASSNLFGQLARSVRSQLILAHVRKARYPRINTFVNTHPFMESCCGKQWVFAHNGLVPEIVEVERGNAYAVCRPEGETDSEYAFCHLLGEIAHNFGTASPNDDGGWFETLAVVSELIASSGKFNFLLSDGDYLIAYGHDRLHYTECSVQNTSTAAEMDFVMIATEPLTAEDSWHAFQPGELRVYRLGRLVGRLRTRPHAAGARVLSVPAV